MDLHHCSGGGIHEVRNSPCGALHSGQAGRWLKELEWDLGRSFWEKIWIRSDCVFGYAVIRLRLMVTVSFNAWTSAGVNVVFF